MPWDTILNAIIAVLLIIVSAVAHRMNGLLAEIGTKLSALDAMVADLGDDSKVDIKWKEEALDTLNSVLKYLRRQLYFEKYQRQVNKLILERLSVAPQTLVDLEAPPAEMDPEAGI